MVAICSKKFWVKTTDSHHKKLVRPNLLKGLKPMRPGEAFVGDITYLPLQNGNWCYLSMFQDVVSKNLAGWTISDRMTADIAVDALKKVLGRVKPGTVIHTDRGSQYVSNKYRNLLKRHGLRQSMSGKGNCYDNAQAESFFGRLKTELLENGAFESIEQGKSEVFSYIEGYYNNRRLHSSIGYQTPLGFERQFNQKNRRSNTVSSVSCFT